ncbi:proline-rich transmembrane protein 1-like [Gigantopelta aegis]|uniref:proline-rich transmembrane protein 1-like n=1 Tax=Gigantopelta aegis TaxID=1735272 RepID=UPI001B888992|nr:proline-rich transmembrane protein 1-like [Gigantopelta aegis]
MNRQGPMPNGAPNPNNSQNMMQPQRVIVIEQPHPNAMVVHGPVPDHTALAICATLCCCCPLGIIALIRAQDAKRASDMGDVWNGHRLARSSQQLSIIGIICGCVCILPSLITFILVILLLNGVCSEFGC